MLFDLIPIHQDFPGFAPFFGAWLCRNNLTTLVDVGPARSAESLLEGLRDAGVERLDYVLLTHIHIDHGGALGALLRRYPAAKVICHEKGLPFMRDPSKLWHGSLKVLGPIAEKYGPPEPLPPEALVPHTRAAVDGLGIIETPGHAPHHLSFTYGGRLFAGEAGGNFFRIKGRGYLRPATPPRFFLNVFLESVERLLALEDQPICYAHCGFNQSSKKWLGIFREQVLRWKDTIQTELRSGQTDINARCAERLLANDPLLAAFEDMDVATQSRERMFMANAVSGFVGFFLEKVQALNSIDHREEA